MIRIRQKIGGALYPLCSLQEIMNICSNCIKKGLLWRDSKSVYANNDNDNNNSNNSNNNNDSNRVTIISNKNNKQRQW